MENSGGINDVLPPDHELVKRDKLFLDLINKYSIDEDSDAELVKDDDVSSVDDNGSDADSSFSEKNSCESEASFNMEEMKQQLIPVIKARVNAWPEKGICLQLKTVDPRVTVEEWLQSNQEYTTTKKNTKETVITEANKTTIITTTKETTTTTRRSVQFIRRETDDNGTEQVKKGTNGDDDNALIYTHSTRGKNHKRRKQEKSKDQSKFIPKNNTPSSVEFQSDVATKRFAIPRPTKRNGQSQSRSCSNVIIPPINFEPPKKIQKTTTEVRKTRSQKNQAPTGNANHDSQIVDNVFDETFGTSNSVQQKSSKELSQPQPALKTSTTNNSMLKHHKRILIHSPTDCDILGTKIDDTSMRVTRQDFEKRIHPLRLHIPDKSYMTESIVPINQKIVYDPPTSDTIGKNNSGNDSESDDELLTSYTRTGHFLRLN